MQKFKLFSTLLLMGFFVSGHAQGPKNFPYPVILIHGINSDAHQCWDNFANFLTSQGWQEGTIIRFNLNGDSDNKISTLSEVTDFSGTLTDADFYRMDFANGYLSNQAAIYKQGLAVKIAVQKVLAATGKDKVILFGHSMGGLAARQYIQTLSQADGQHHVAKLVTSGTPHGGTDVSSETIANALNIDLHSDAVRDLRSFYFTPPNPPHNGVFLFGGVEDSNFMFDNGVSFYNHDVNCNGITGDNVQGLNQKSLSTNLDFSCIIGNWALGGDGIVGTTQANLKKYRSVQSETFTVSGFHIDLPNLTSNNIEALDEPDNAALAYKIKEDVDYNGHITTQAPDAVFPGIDHDYFVFSNPNPAQIVINVDNAPVFPFKVAVLNSAGAEVFAQPYSNSTFQTPAIQLASGNYYLKFSATSTANSWPTTYKFKVSTLACEKPVVPSLSGISSNYATLNWVALSGSLSVQIEKQAGNSGTWTTVGTASISQPGYQSYYVTGLAPSTAYLLRIRSVCGTGIYSDWVVLPSPFTTQSACPVPTNTTTTGITDQSAYLDWDFVAQANNYTITLATPDGVWADTITPNSAIYGSYYTLKDLYSGSAPNGIAIASNTTYKWKVRSNCGSNIKSDWSPENTFTTSSVACNSPSTSQIVISNIGAGTFRVTCNAPGVSYSIRTRKVGSSWSLSKSFPSGKNYIDISGLYTCSTYDVEVRVKCSSGGNTSNFSAIKRVTTTGCMSNFTVTPAAQTVGTAAGTANINLAVTNAYWAATDDAGWLTLSPSLGNGNASIVATFTANTSGSARTASIYFTAGSETKVVTITQSGTASCGTPTGLQTTDISATSIKANWTAVGSALNYTLQTWSASTGQWKDINPPTFTVTAVTINGFAPGTSSQWRVRANCSNGQSGDWTSGVAFTTLPANTLTVSPSNQNVSSVSGTATFTISSNISWSATDNASWITISPTSGSNNGAFTATFSANTSSTLRTGTITLTGGGLTQTVTVTQAGSASCNAPTGLQMTNITQNTVTIGWGSVAGAVSYQVQFLLNGAWTNVGSPTTNLSAGFYGLNPNNSYTWRVLTNCANNQQSAPSASVTFSTPTVPNCSGGSQWPESALTPTSNWLYQSQVYGGEYCLVNVQSGTVYSFSYCASDGASLAFDGQISIRNTSDQLLSFNDNFCGTAPKIVWQASFTGQVRVLLTKNSCLSQATSSTMAFKTGGNLTGDNPENRSTESEFSPLAPAQVAGAGTSEATTVGVPGFDVAVFPNPNAGLFTIRIPSDAAEEIAEVLVLDPLGRILWSRNAADALDAVDFSIDGSTWPNGVYIVRVRNTEGGNLDKKVIVVR